MVLKKKSYSGNTVHSLFGVLLTTLMVLVSGCSDKEESVEMDKVPMQVQVVNGMAVSRGLITDEYIPSGSIGVTILDMEGNDYDGIQEYKNVKYTTYDGQKWLSEIIPGLTLRAGKAVAYYPYSETIQDVTSIPIKTEEQQDVMYSEWVENISSLAPVVEFEMKHALAGVRVILKKEATHTGTINVSDVSIESSGFYTSATFDATTGELSNQENPGAKILMPDLDLELDVNGKEIDFVVITTETAEMITFMTAVNDNQYFSEITPSSALIPGHIHTFTFVLTAKGAELEGVTVNPWQMVKEGDDNNMNFYDEYYQNGIICTYYTTANGSLKIANSVSSVSKMMVDGVEMTPSTTVNVTAGEHVVKYLFKKSNNNYIVPSSAFTSVTSLKSVYISKGITEIGASAFESCSGITGVDFSNAVGLVTIGNKAFYQNTSLSKVDLSKATNLTKLGTSYRTSKSYDDYTDYATPVFGKCTSLLTVKLPESLMLICNGAFINCTNLVDINIPSSVEQIGLQAFYGCKKIEDIDLSQCNKMTVLSYALFSNSGLKSIKLPVSLTSINDAVFQICPFTSLDWSHLVNLERIGYTYFPGSINDSGSEYWTCTGIFYDCRNLESIKLPENLKTIYGGTFQNCVKLSDIQIPASVTTLGAGVFYNADALEFIDLSNNTITSNPPLLFAGANIKQIKLPKGITTITKKMFSSCPLEQIEIPNTVTKIDDYAFNGCMSLTDITIPNSVVSIGKQSFYQCDNITSIKIGKNVSTIGEQAFSLKKVENIIVDGNNSTFNSNNNCNAIIQSATNTLILGCKNSVIPDNCSGIGNNAFYECYDLTGIEIPASIKSIGNYAFYNSKIAYIRFLGSVAPSWGSNVLSNNRGIVIIPDGTSDSYTTIINFLSGTRYFTSVQQNECFIENEIVYSADGKNLLGTTGKANGIVSIKEGVETLSKYVLCRANKMTELILPNSLVTINDYAIYYCDNLKSITIGKNVQTIGSYFVDGNVYSVNKITSLATVAPTVNSYAFIRFASTGVLYVPIGSANSYNKWISTDSYYLNYSDGNWKIVEF